MLLNRNVSLSQAGAADWTAVEALLRANKLPTEGARQHLPTYLLAVTNGKVVGCAGAEVYGDIALLRSVAVAPGLQGRGIGQLLVERLLLEASRQRIRRLYLLTVTAPEYFARYGFKRGKIGEAPDALKASAELQGACPACAAFMSLTLTETKSPRTDLPVAVARLIEHELPLAGEIVDRVLQPHAALPAVHRALHLDTKVTAISREGFEQARSVVAAVAGDLAAAERVELELPETGVCGLGVADAGNGGTACCGNGEPVPVAVPAP